MTLHNASAAALLGALALNACAPQKPPAPLPPVTVDVVALAAELRETYQNANELTLGGETNAAVALLGRTLADTRFNNYENRLQAALQEITDRQAAEQARRQEEAEANPDQPVPPPDPTPFEEPEISYGDVGYRRQMLEQMVRASLRHTTPDATLAHILPIFDADEALALDGLGLIHEELRTTLPAAGLLEWAARLVKTPKLPAAALNRAMDWEYNAALDAGQDDHAIGALAAILVKRGPDNASVAFAQNAVDQFIQRRRLESLSKLLDTLKRAKSNTALDNLLLAARVRLAVASADWGNCAPLVASASAALPDNPGLHTLLQQVLPAIEKSGQPTLMDTIAKNIVTNQPNKTNSVRRVIQYWERDAHARNPADFPNRVQLMMDAGVNPPDVFDTISTFFYNTSDNPDPAILQRLRAQGEKLFTNDATGKLAIAPYCLIDMAFSLEDFDGVLRILEAGVPDKNESWHVMAAIKVKAHKALHNNDIPGAVEQFRLFMRHLDQHGVEEDFADPALGQTLPKEAVLGRNAKRIADLLAESNPAESAKALDEARAYYATAVESAKTPEIKALVEKEAKEIQP
ncbi:MAG: hypothetical protein FWF96_01315 [Kiritimatiellaeota bacterium]|nr:hypothetical protein [Kiritimatiellota bacterium]